MRRALLLATLVACRNPDRARRVTTAEAPQLVAAADVSDRCADLAEVRVCWTANAGPAWVARKVPATPAPTELGFRCTGVLSGRACVDRALAAPPFTCTPTTDGAARCEQIHPRVPDGGPWSCTATAGATVCVGPDAAALAGQGALAPGWFCGRRASGLDRRVCVDLDPDFPDGKARGWRCRYSPEVPLRRVCEADPAAATLGASCDPARPCVDGASCVSGVCLLPYPSPGCAIDDDCPSRRCRFGSCAGAS